ncbi:MAG: bifunctional pyr operon transcriptional regulator/uracil phosphoribosyltransferase, partial [Acidimicrobiia bacterium]|nr:bifunctional pyr operon transcriptional regulator/uracil phosphoribosyltransferase [Acidimicrobiia bacterium]
MAERERLLAGQPASGAFRARTQVMSTDDVARAIRRMAHEILEKNHGCD